MPLLLWAKGDASGIGTSSFVVPFRFGSSVLESQVFVGSSYTAFFVYSAVGFPHGSDCPFISSLLSGNAKSLSHARKLGFEKVCCSL